jgi:hypothetical protein
MARKRIEDTRLVSFGNAKPYRATDSEALRRTRPPDMLIDRFMVAGFVCGLTSYPGVGKTWFALAIAESIVTGEKLMGEFPVVDGPSGVLFVGSDSSEADYGQQWKRLTEQRHAEWEASFDADNGDEPPPNPYRRAKFLIQSPFMTDNPDEVKRIILTALDETQFPRATTIIDGEVVTSERPGCALIVMDTLSRLTVANQNDNTEMERVFANVRTICEVTGAAVLLLHHNSKATEFNDGEDWRGAMSQIGALDSWIQLSNSKKNKNKIKAAFRKFRGITPANFEYEQFVDDPRVASLKFLGQADGQFGREVLKDEILAAFSDWHTIFEVEEKLWPSYAEQFKTREQFHTAVKNRVSADLKEKLDERPGPKVAGKPGKPPKQFKSKTAPAAEAPKSGELPEN